MTLLFFTRLFYPHIGGVETHVYELCKRLIARGNRVVVVTEETPKPHSNANQSERASAKIADELQGIEIHRIPVQKLDWVGKYFKEKLKKFFIWIWLWKHRSLIAQADIVHCHDVFFWYLPFRILYPRKKVYTTFHGYEGKYPPTKAAIFLRQLSQRLSTGTIAVGNFIEKWYGTRSQFVTYGGADIVKSQKSKVKSQKNNSKLKILFIGRLEKDIGVTTYLNVLDILKKKSVGFIFEACGDGLLRSNVAQYGKVYGFVDDVKQYIFKADIVFTSSYLTILDALAAKKPVFSVYENLLKEDYLKMSPFVNLIDIDNNPAKIADKIFQYISNKKTMEEKIEKGFAWVKKQSWDAVFDMYLRLWKNK